MDVHFLLCNICMFDAADVYHLSQEHSDTILQAPGRSPGLLQEQRRPHHYLMLTFGQNRLIVNVRQLLSMTQVLEHNG